MLVVRFWVLAIVMAACSTPTNTPRVTPGVDSGPGFDSGLGGFDSGGRTPPMSVPLDFGDGGPRGCRHEAGGAFAHFACTLEWQCCDGAFVPGTVGCGGPCICLEETGAVGCLGPSNPGFDAGPFDSGITPGFDAGPPPGLDAGPVAPPGASCTHTTQGGVYANTACSEMYQCCNGTWQLGTNVCGSCLCVEPTGAIGCGSMTPPPPPTDSGTPGGSYPHGPSTIPSSPSWSCSGLTGTTWNPTGVYYTTSFGCWVDSGGGRHQDPGDNCIPACSVSSIGCSGLSGPECEYSLNWYVADTDRFGCGTKLRLTAPENGKKVVVVAIDRGPNCTIERRVNHWVLDVSTRVSMYLFGEQTAATERREVVVEVVPESWALGPM